MGEMPNFLPEPISMSLLACVRVCARVHVCVYRECSGETALLALFDKHQNMASKACVCTLQIIVVNIIECSKCDNKREVGLL